MSGWIAYDDLIDADQAVCAMHGDRCDDHFVCAGCHEVTHVVVVSGPARTSVYGDPPMCADCRGWFRGRRRSARRDGRGVRRHDTY